MRFNVAYVKQHPAMFGTIFVVFGLLLWLMLNKGHASSGGGQYVTTGPSEALQAANLQAGTAIQLKQLDLAGAAQSGQMQLAALTAQINGQEQMANMQMQYQFAELAANSALGSKQIDASLIALQAQLDNQLELANSNNQFMVDYAKVAADNATAQVMINANLQSTLGAQAVDLQKQLSADQLKAYTVGNLVNSIQFAPSQDRDNLVATISAQITGAGVNYIDQGGVGNVYVPPSLH